MKKILNSLLLVIILSLQTGCSTERVEPIEDPQLELFETVYETNFYSILKRIDIGDEIYVSIGYLVGKEDFKCMVGAYHRANYMVYYDGEYYDFVDANALELYTCDVLIEQGIIQNE